MGLGPVDLRGGFDRLAGDVRRLGADPLDGQLYLFVSRRRTQLRALWFDRSGWAMYSNHLASHYTSFGCDDRVEFSPSFARFFVARSLRVLQRLGAFTGGAPAGTS